MEKKFLVTFIMVLILLTSGCSSQKNDSVSDGGTGAESSGSSASGAASSGGASAENGESDSSGTITSNGATGIDVSQMFSDRDFEVGYDESASAIIELNGDSATCSSDAVQISGSTVTIIDEGTYIISGTLEDGMIIVNSEKTDKTQLVLNGVSIHSETSAPIYILQSDKVFITLAEGTENVLSNGGTFTAIDENNIDAAIFSREDLTLNGSGSLVITSPAGHGIVSKDELTLTSGSYDISSASHGLVGKDGICIANASFAITSGKDGIHAENSDDTSLGYVYIQSGTFQISAEGDGISAAADMQIEDGSFDITSGGGSANATKTTSDSWGNFMGGGRHSGGTKGGTSGGSETAASADAEDDGTSIKGIKASGNILINGGTFSIDSADDSLHSNASVTIQGGNFQIASGDDGIHADDTLTITDGTVHISESYEGLEGLHVNISGGDITLTASDDGLNAAGGTDSSGFGGQRGNDKFGGRGGNGSSSSDGSITISGGTIYVNASGDGIDANGTLTISGGNTIVCGPTQGDTATLDYDVSGIITGGTFIGTGASGMAQTFSDSEQGVIAVSVGNNSAGTAITLTDAEGNTMLSHSPELSFAVVIISSPDIVKGETYTITVGSSSGEVTAN